MAVQEDEKVYKKGTILYFTLSIGYAGASQMEEFECYDDMTEEEVENEWQEWMWGYVDGGFSEHKPEHFD